MVSLLASCNNDAPDQPDRLPIDLLTSIDNRNWVEKSRVVQDGEDRSILDFSDGDEIVVDMWRMPNGEGSASNAPDILRRKVMTYADSSWDYSPKKVWSDTVGDRIAVLAYHLAGATNCVVNEDWDESSGYPTFTFTGASEDYDILVSPVKMIKKNDLVGEKVPIEFRHIKMRMKMEIRYWSDEEDCGEWTSLYIDNIDFWNHPRGAVFKGFDSDMVPQWEITDYPTGRGVNVTTNKIIPWGKDFISLPDATQFHYPFVCKHASAQDGHIDNAKFGLTVYKQNENGDRVYLTHDKNYFEKYFDTEIVGGCSYLFRITINPHNQVELQVEKETNNDVWWTGTHTDTTVGF